MFIALPVGMNYLTRRLPVVTFTLIGLNTAIWLATLACAISTEGESNDWVYEHLWLIPAQSSLITYLTSMFVHGGFFHLFGNMIFLFLFGCCVEDLLGRVRFLVFYLAGGFIAEMAHIAFSPHHFMSTVPMGGASGAISACMGMYLLLRTSEDIEFKYLFWFGYVRAGEFTLPAWVAISFWFARDLFSMLIGMMNDRSGGGVAFGAHVGGMLAGIALVAMHRQFGKRFEPPEPEEGEEENHPKTRLGAMIPKLAEPEPEPRPFTPTVSETPTIYLHNGVEQTGPFTLSQVQAMLRRGTINADTRYWSEGLENWQDIADLSDRPT